jgi:N-methylhydantoinase A
MASVINRIFARLEKEVREALHSQGIEFAEVSVQREIDIRYSLQLAEVSTPVKNGELTDDDVAVIAASFEDLYERRFGKGTGFKDAGFQFISYRVFATGHLSSKPRLPGVPAADEKNPLAPKVTRCAYLDAATGWVETAVYDYQDLRAGHRLSPPAIIEAPTTTVVLPEGHEGVVDALGNLVITKLGER